MTFAEAEAFHAAIRDALRAKLPQRFTRGDVDLDIADRSTAVVEWLERHYEDPFARIAAFAPILNALDALAREEAAE